MGMFPVVMIVSQSMTFVTSIWSNLMTRLTITLLILTPIGCNSQAEQSTDQFEPIGIIVPVADQNPTDKVPVPENKPLDPAKVNKAIDAGVAYLRKKSSYHNPGIWIGGDLNLTAHDKQTISLGADALKGIAMLECGVPADDAAIKTIADDLRKNISATNDGYAVYSIALTLLFFDRLHQGKATPADDRKRIQSLALRLVAGQRPNSNLWRYYIPTLKEDQETQILNQLKNKTFKSSNKYFPFPYDDCDLSCSQFVTLALWASRRHGIPVDTVIQDAAITIRKAQLADGGWTYQPRGGISANYSATCAGLIILALDHGTKEPKKTENVLRDPAVMKGLAYLGKVLNDPLVQKGHTGPNAISFCYFLWTLERTAVILNLEKIGERDWHKWGTDYLLAKQENDGGWHDIFYGIPDTSFALLFLKRSNLFPDLTNALKREEKGSKVPDAVPK
jgi:hypothetical protein